MIKGSIFNKRWNVQTYWTITFYYCLRLKILEDWLEPKMVEIQFSLFVSLFASSCVCLFVGKNNWKDNESLSRLIFFLFKAGKR